MTVSSTTEKKALAIAVLGTVGALAGVMTAKQAFFVGYLQAFGYWTAISLGCLGILQIHGLTGGGWGHVIRPFLKAGIRMLPITAILFIPLVVAGPSIYSWMNPEVVEGNHILHAKHAWLNRPGFIARTVLYYVIWCFFGFWMVKNIDKNNNKFMCGLGFLFTALTVSFAAFDWFMSIEPEWFSSIYGAMYMIGGGLETFACCLLLAILFKREMTTDEMHDLGKFLLMSVMVWAYFNFSQLIIIWSAELPEEMTWYYNRMHGGWQYLGLAVVVGHFFVPFLLLLSRPLKRSRKFLAGICVYLLFIRGVDFWFLIKPAFSSAAITFPHWEIVAMAAVGGIWFFGFSRMVRGYSESLTITPISRELDGPEDRQ